MTGTSHINSVENSKQKVTLSLGPHIFFEARVGNFRQEFFFPPQCRSRDSHLGSSRERGKVHVYHKARKWVVEKAEVVSLTIGPTPIASALARGGEKPPPMAAAIVAVPSGEHSIVFRVPSSSSPTRGLA